MSSNRETNQQKVLTNLKQLTYKLKETKDKVTITKIIKTITCQTKNLLTTINNQDLVTNDKSQIIEILTDIIQINIGQHVLLFEALIILVHKASIVLDFVALMYRTSEGEHLILNLTQLCQAEWTIYKTNTLPSSVFQNLCQISPAEFDEGVKANKTTTIVKNAALFFEKASETLPQVWAQKICLILPHLASPVAIRSAIVTGISNVCAKTNYSDFSVLIERCQDVNYQVRARAIKALQLCLKQISIQFWPGVLRVAVARLQDKAELVRSAALNLIFEMVETSPFGVDLEPKKWHGSLNNLREKMVTEEMAVGFQGLDQSQSGDVPPEQQIDVGQLLDNLSEQQSDDEEEELQQQQQRQNQEWNDKQIAAGIKGLINGGINNDDQNMTRFLIKCVELGLQFIEQVQLCVYPLFEILSSRSKHELLKAIPLIGILSKVNIEGEIKVLLWCMLELVSAQLPEVKQKVAEQFYQLYLRQQNAEDEESEFENVVKNLLQMFSESSIGEVEIIGEIVDQLLKLGLIQPEVIEFIITTYRDLDEQELYGALRLLAQLILPGRVNLGDNVESVLDVCLDILGNQSQTRIVKSTLEVASKLDLSKQTHDRRQDFAIIVIQILKNKKFPLKDWTATAQNGVEVLLQCLQWDAQQIRQFCNDLQTYFEIYRQEDVCKVMFLGGQIAISMLSYIQHAISQCQNQQNSRGNNSQSQLIEFTRFQEVCQEQILDSVLPRQIIELILNMSNLCSQEKRIQIQQYSLIALARLMLTSKNLCTQHVETLLTPLTTRSVGVDLRRELVLCFEDLIRQFPNVLENWAKLHIPLILSDPDESVRELSLETIERLVLSDWMKLRGYAAKVAKLLADDSQTLRCQAINFLQSIKRKDEKILINHIDEVISEVLSDECILEDQFNTITTSILKICQQDPLIVNKLLKRLGNVSLNPLLQNKIVRMIRCIKPTLKSAFVFVEHYHICTQALANKEVYEIIYAFVKAGKGCFGNNSDMKQLFQDTMERMTEYVYEHAEDVQSCSQSVAKDVACNNDSDCADGTQDMEVDQ